MVAWTKTGCMGNGYYRRCTCTHNAGEGVYYEVDTSQGPEPCLDIEEVHIQARAASRKAIPRFPEKLDKCIVRRLTPMRNVLSIKRRARSKVWSGRNFKKAA